MAFSGIEAWRYTRKHGAALLLNIGAQKNRPKGWFNVDKYPTFGTAYMNAERMRRLRTESFSAVLCEHMIEHVPKPAGLCMCREIHRILKPGGVARFVTPDISRMCAIVADPTESEGRYVDLIRAHLRRPEELQLLLLEAGFATTTITSANGFSNPIFRNAQGHSRLLGEELNDLEAFGIEAVR